MASFRIGRTFLCHAACSLVEESYISHMASPKPGSTKEELLQKLSPEQYAVTQQCSTEPPFQNKYWNHHEPGIYVDVVDGTPLFSSLDKFDSHSGWPSFTKPIKVSMMEYRQDSTHGMIRTEVKSALAQSHLGHVFDDGPGPDHKRFCINSASLRFVHARDLDKEGYGDYLVLFPAFQTTAKTSGPAEEASQENSTETALLAGGCFWGMQELLRVIPGVLATQVGYTGGNLHNPGYSDVKKGQSGHAEAVQVVFDPKQVSYEALLDAFFRIHDPTTPNRQGNDRGPQYRSVIFYTSPQQKELAEKKIRQWNTSKKWPNPIVTEVAPAGPFYRAEEEHQDYLQKYPDGYTCHYYRSFP